MTTALGDLGGDGVPAASSHAFNDILAEQTTRRWFRSVALGAALLTLFVLLSALAAIVWTFLSEFRVLALDTQIQLAAAPHLSAAPAAAAASTAGDAPRIWVSLGAFTTSIAALVTAMVVAVTVLAIALVRASFTLTARGDDAARAAADAAEDAPLTLPAAEFVKAFGESLQTALKGVQGLPRNVG